MKYKISYNIPHCQIYPTTNMQHTPLYTQPQQPPSQSYQTITSQTIDRTLYPNNYENKKKTTHANQTSERQSVDSDTVDFFAWCCWNTFDNNSQCCENYECCDHYECNCCDNCDNCIDCDTDD